MNTTVWKGVMPALLTPFTANDKIDYPMFEKNVKAQISAGVHGLIVCGSLGEASTLSAEEKTDLLASACEIANKKVPVVINIAEQSTKDALKAIKGAEKNHADGLMILPPMRYKADERETFSFLRTLAESTSLPIMLYNNPHDYKIEVTPDMFEELLKIENIQAVKESTRDVTNVSRLRNRFGNRLKILCGVDTIAYQELVSGADGWIAGLVDAFPRETVVLYELIVQGRYEEALALHRWFLPLLELDVHPKLVQYIKLAAVQTGLSTEHVRSPRLVIQDKEREKILAVISKAMENRPQMENYFRKEKSSTGKMEKAV